MFYLAFITLGFGIGHIILVQIFAQFFEERFATIDRSVWTRTAVIVLLSAATTIGALLVKDPEWENRMLHFWAGGVMAFFLSISALMASRVRVTALQGFLISALIATALGVTNEITEAGLQHFFGLTFATSIMDTWLDLLSNSLGILLAAAVTFPQRHRFLRA